MAILLDLLLQPLTRAKPSVRRSAVIRTRRALRSVNMTFCISCLVTDPLVVPYSSP
jgi:hypothetical protein